MNRGVVALNLARISLDPYSTRAEQAAALSEAQHVGISVMELLRARLGIRAGVASELFVQNDVPESTIDAGITFP